jgi:hypothetical protein
MDRKVKWADYRTGDGPQTISGARVADLAQHMVGLYHASKFAKPYSKAQDLYQRMMIAEKVFDARVRAMVGRRG